MLTLQTRFKPLLQRGGVKSVVEVTVKSKEENQRLNNMELDLQSLFGLHVHSSTHWLRPR